MSTAKTHLEQAGELLEYILALDLAKCNLTVCIAAGSPATGDYQFRRIKQSDKLAQKFREAINAGLAKFRDYYEENGFELHDFAAETDKPDQEIECLNLLPYDSIKKQIESVENYGDMPHFQHDERNFIDKMKFYVIRIKPTETPPNAWNNQPIYFFRQYWPSQMLSLSPKFGMLWRLQDGQYDDLSEPTFLFDRQIDCFCSEDNMFILQKNNFFDIFDISELKKVAEEMLDKLEKRDIIHNFRFFREDCLKDKNKILKLKNISTKTYMDKITVEEMEKTINHYNLKQDISVVIDPRTGRKKLNYQRGGKRWAILHLLDDAYADSLLTKRSYHLKGKREIQRKRP